MDTGIDAKALREEIEGLDWHLTSDGWERGVYLGTVFALTPSGKYYTSWACGNVTEEEAALDEEWYEAVEEQLAKQDLYLTSGEGDPCDLFACEGRDILYEDHMGPDA
jgi:hypothetical protein